MAVKSNGLLQTWESLVLAIIFINATSSILSCDFEKDDLCGWTHSSKDEFDWLRISGATPSGSTGPSFDHTFGRTESAGHYMYVETSAPRKPGDRAKLVSPLYLPDQSDKCFQLWYHMFGPDGPNDVGSLEVFVQPEGVGMDTLVPELREEGNKGDVWLRGVAKIPPLSDKFQIVILARRKESYISDIAIDDLRLYSCSEDEGTENTSLSSLSSTSMKLTTAKSKTTRTTANNGNPKPATTKTPTQRPEIPKPITKPPTQRSTTPKPLTPKPTTTTAKTTASNSMSKPSERPTSPTPKPTKRTRQTKPTTAKPTKNTSSTKAVSVTSVISTLVVKTSPTHKPSSASITATAVYSTSNSTFTDNANISSTTVYEVDIRPSKTSSDDNNGHLMPMGIGIGIGVLFMVQVAIFAWYWAKKKKRRSVEPYDE